MHTVHSSPSRAASPTSWCELLLMLLLLHGVRSLLVGPPTFNSVHLFPGGSVGGPAVSTGRCPSGGAVVRMMGVPKLQQKSAAKPSLSSFDGVTREAFLAGTAAVIVAGLAPGTNDTRCRQNWLFFHMERSWILDKYACVGVHEGSFVERAGTCTR